MGKSLVSCFFETQCIYEKTAWTTLRWHNGDHQAARRKQLSSAVNTGPAANLFVFLFADPFPSPYADGMSRKLVVDCWRRSVRFRPTACELSANVGC